MKLIKDNVIISLKNENHAEAYKKSGWIEYTEPVEKPAPKAKTAEAKATKK